MAERNQKNIIGPYELDIFCPDRKLAFEFDGLYWHSDAVGKNRTYHLDKTEKCRQNGIRLVHVFENEWLFKRAIVESRIRSIFGEGLCRIFARKCRIMEVDSATAVSFTDRCHIQGAVAAKVRLGLVFEGKLVALMTFGKCRFDRKHEWEMLRFCCELNTRVIGGASRLLAYFEKKYRPKSLVTYADRRWSEGQLYTALGFKLSHMSPPDYWYFKPAERVLRSRFGFQKHKLKTCLEAFDPDKTETENMKINGYYRIFDCGNMVFEKDYIS